MSTINFKIKCQDTDEIFGGYRTTDRELYMSIQTTSDVVCVFDEYGDGIVGESVDDFGLFTAIGMLYQAYEAWEDEKEMPECVELCGEPVKKEKDEFMSKASSLVATIQRMMFYHRYDGQRLGEPWTYPKEWNRLIEQAEKSFRELMEMGRAHNPISQKTTAYPKEHLTY